MKIIQYVKEWTRHEWPTIEAQQPRFFRLAMAYACMSCRTVQDGADHGRCYSCGSGNIRSVDDAFNWITNEIHQRLEEAKAKKRQKQESDEASRRENVARVEQFLAENNLDQSLQTLTEFRAKD